MIQFLEFDCGSRRYDQVLRLRTRVLREPLGLAYREEDLAAERDQWHFALVEGEAALACLIAAPLDATTCKLRQMAVAPGRRGEGLGRRLVTEVEAALRDRGVRAVTLHARAEAVGFYEKLGYEAFGEEFVEVTIPHRAMRKPL